MPGKRKFKKVPKTKKVDAQRSMWQGARIKKQENER